MNKEVFKPNIKTISVAIFASGQGSNAKQFIHFFRNNSKIKINLIVSNKSQAGVLSIAANEQIPTLILEKNKFFEDGYATYLKSLGIDFIVLAGFLWMIPEPLLVAFPNKIVNIHPALLPRYGGKGMYGKAVHQAVLAAEEKESGITIHYVDEKYDNGQIIFQKKFRLQKNETAESLEEKVHHLEHAFYPKIVEKLLMKNQKV